MCAPFEMPHSSNFWYNVSNLSTVSLLRMDFMARVTATSLSCLPACCLLAQEFSEVSNLAASCLHEAFAPLRPLFVPARASCLPACARQSSGSSATAAAGFGAGAGAGSSSSIRSGKGIVSGQGEPTTSGALRIDIKGAMLYLITSGAPLGFGGAGGATSNSAAACTCGCAATQSAGSSVIRSSSTSASSSISASATSAATTSATAGPPPNCTSAPASTSAAGAGKTAGSSASFPGVGACLTSSAFSTFSTSSAPSASDASSAALSAGAAAEAAAARTSGFLATRFGSMRPAV
mmetsp:Transcript_86038/g.248418  ORF Transcript_86038/g.248418 Transcript_86038/m.248418 type:complete len:293 (+) Transcript_86038:1995-2873(+)